MSRGTPEGHGTANICEAGPLPPLLFVLSVRVVDLALSQLTERSTARAYCGIFAHSKNCGARETAIAR
jgi:hypothetical protein